MSSDFELTPLEQELMDAIRMKRVADVEDCIASGAGVNFIAGYFEERPLHFAAQCNCPDIIALLVEKGARVDVTDQQGQTPLFHAAEKGAIEAVLQLLSLKSDPNHVAHTGRTALFGAAMRGHVAVIDALTAAGADPNFEASGSAPLFYAVNNSHFDAAQALVRGGAHVNARNSEGLTAGEVALRKDSDYRPDMLMAQFLTAAHIQIEATNGTEKPVAVMKRLQFKAGK